LIATTDLTIHGIGLIVLDKDYIWELSNLKTMNGATITNDPKHTIGGQGYILASLINEGTIAANITDHSLRVLSETNQNPEPASM